MVPGEPSKGSSSRKLEENHAPNQDSRNPMPNSLDAKTTMQGEEIVRQLKDPQSHLCSLTKEESPSLLFRLEELGLLRFGSCYCMQREGMGGV